MSGGYMGRILFVNLSQGEIREEEVEEKLYRDFLGGYGLGARILYSRQPGGVDPLGPKNHLGFVTGPLTGIRGLLGSRFTVVGKSPLTGCWGDANAGGYFGPHLKFSGYDAVFFIAGLLAVASALWMAAAPEESASCIRRSADSCWPG